MTAHAPGRPPVTEDLLRSHLARLQAVDSPAEQVLAALTDQLKGRTPRGPPLPELPQLPPAMAAERAGPWLLGQTLEVLRGREQRTALGAWFTPPELARELVAAAGVPAPRRVLDPACGGGVFLLAAHERFPAARLLGRDIDPLAVRVTTAALDLAGAVDVDVALGDGLAPLTGSEDHDDPGNRAVMHADPGHHGADGMTIPAGNVDLVVGNPPFLSQLRRVTARDRQRRRALRDRFGAAVTSYVDEAGLFLLVTATEVLAEGGVAVLVVPESLLATADAAPVRAVVERHCEVEVVWRDTGRVFPGVVACALRLTRRQGEKPPSSRRTGWSSLLAQDVPRVTADEAWATIGADATATADFRDAYYQIARHVQEDAADLEGHRIVPVGLIDPAHLRWGTTPIRFAKQRWQRPVAVGLPSEFLQRRLGPKVLVATQSRVLEALVDVEGELLPTTPVITLRSDRLFHVGAALTSPVATALAARRHAGAARSRGALKLSARQVLDLPLPASPSTAWDDAAEVYRRAHETADPEARRMLLLRCGRAMSAAYGVQDEALVSWWAARLPTR